MDEAANTAAASTGTTTGRKGDTERLHELGELEGVNVRVRRVGERRPQQLLAKHRVGHLRVVQADSGGEVGLKPDIQGSL